MFCKRKICFYQVVILIEEETNKRLLKAMINKAVSPKIITNYSNILQAVEGCFETNMSSEDIKSLVQTQLDDMSKWKMYNVQLTGDPEISYKNIFYEAVKMLYNET